MYKRQVFIVGAAFLIGALYGYYSDMYEQQIREEAAQLALAVEDVYKRQAVSSSEALPQEAASAAPPHR